MNLFATDDSPERSARALDDRRVVKMAVEAAQLLSTAMRLRGLRAPYRPTHAAHPATRWTGATRGNFRWVVRHLAALGAEYHRRFGRVHASARFLPRFANALPRFPPGRRRPFANLSGHPRVLPVTRAYRRHLIEKWRTAASPPRWTRARPPRWARLGPGLLGPGDRGSARDRDVGRNSGRGSGAGVRAQGPGSPRAPGAFIRSGSRPPYRGSRR